jgi:hypothetical protein
MGPISLTYPPSGQRPSGSTQPIPILNPPLLLASNVPHPWIMAKILLTSQFVVTPPHWILLGEPQSHLRGTIWDMLVNNVRTRKRSYTLEAHTCWPKRCWKEPCFSTILSGSKLIFITVRFSVTEERGDFNKNNSREYNDEIVMT